MIDASQPLKYNTHNFSLYKLTKNWGEGNSKSTGMGSSATANDATWIYNFYNSIAWTNLGGDYSPIASATSGVTYANFPLQYGTWDNLGMKNDVISWITNPANNFGWILIGEKNTVGSAKKFTSRQKGFYDKPTLTIFYTLPTIDKFLINEVNRQNKWVELYNPSKPLVTLSNYYLTNANATQSLTNMTVLNGILTLDSA